MTHTLTLTPTLIDGLALFPAHDTPHNESRYYLGTPARRIEITTPVQRAAILALREGGDPYQSVDRAQHAHVDALMAELHHLGFLNTEKSSIFIPHRYLDSIGERDIAAQQLRERVAPEILAPQWIDGHRDRGATTLQNRSDFAIALSGRSRVISLLHSILLGSGVSQVTFSDYSNQPSVSFTDIGISAISSKDLGSNIYHHLDEKRREITLFPTARNTKRDTRKKPADLVIHDGPVDPDLLSRWMSAGQSHFLIHPSFGDQLCIGPLVVPYTSPCLRCFYLTYRDHTDFLLDQRIALTPVKELPLHLSYIVAGFVAQTVLHYIDQMHDEIDRKRQTLVGEFLEISLQKSTQPHVVALSNHPLCGCKQ